MTMKKPHKIQQAASKPAVPVQESQPEPVSVQKAQAPAFDPAAVSKEATGFARFVENRWGVPSWLTLGVMAVTTGFGASTKAPHNWTNVPAVGTMRAHPSGYAWFPSVVAGADAFGQFLSRTEPYRAALDAYRQDKDGRALCRAFRAYDGDISEALTHYIEGAQ